MSESDKSGNSITAVPHITLHTMSMEVISRFKQGNVEANFV